VSQPSLLIGDLGGTNARFALAAARDPGYTDEMVLECSAYDSAEDAIGYYLEETGAPKPGVICLAVAGPVVDHGVRFLNNTWSLDLRNLQARFPDARIRLLNDFQAIAYAVPRLGTGDVEAVGLPRSTIPQSRDFAVGLIGPGTGLGVSGLLRSGGRLHALSSEGGHQGFAPESKVQVAILEQLRQRFDRVSDERLLSGPGIQNIYRALCTIHDRQLVDRTAAEVFDRARDNSDEIASETVHVFFEVLGQVAGNLALALGAQDGIFIAGGIVQRYPDRLKSGPFRSGFENKGRHRSLMERIPTCLITHPQPGLLGASFLARHGEGE
jgi:glucokinase